jgi:recombinational DNA repair ATPase RecF
MEKRVLTLELAVEQNTAMGERLDRSMALLTQGMADLRVQMVQGFAEVRQEITSVKAELQQEIASVQLELRQEISASQSELRKEIAASHADLHKFFERKFMWLLTAYSGGLLTLVGFLGKYLIDSYAK